MDFIPVLRAQVGYWNSSETDSSRRLVLNMSSLPARAEETAVSPTPAQDDILKVAMVLVSHVMGTRAIVMLISSTAQSIDICVHATGAS